ncbi:MAG: DUF3575 domain-containing protein [Bacteroides sp.]|jgi:hypothetical protein|nr:DUF3575 domain-containing protein [Bacteroides sp.]
MIKIKRNDIADVFLLLLFWSVGVWGQSLAVKSDLVSDALFSPNVSVEPLLSAHWSMEASIHYQPLALDSRHRWKHWLGRLEFRRWLCSPYAGLYYGFHALGGQFNVGDVNLPLGLYRGVRNSRYEGWVWGGGLSVGYQWILSSRWGLEGSLGAGVVFADYSRYRCGHCGDRTASGRHKTYLGPTRGAISLVYLLK